MKNKLLKRIAILAMATLTTVMLTGCGDSNDKKGSTSNSGKKVEETSSKKVTTTDITYDTQDINLDKCSFKVPANWTEQEITASSHYLYYPANADTTTGTSSVNILIQDVSGSTDINDYYDIKSSLEEQITSQFSSATNFNFSDFSTEKFDVFVMEYDVTQADVTMHMKQFMPLLGDSTVVITTTNIGDNVDPDPALVGQIMTETLQMK